MASLFWDWNQYELSLASEDIGEVMSGLGQAMQQNGYQGVAVAQDVHGFKPGVDLFAGITFLFISGRTFWQIVAVGGDGTQEQAQAEIANIQSIISNLKFL